MTQAEMAAGLIERSTEMLKKHLDDFTDADLLARPVPAANHAAWQLAHLANFEVMVAKSLSPDANLPMPATMETGHRQGGRQE